jgi:hypothetical protein
MNLSKSLFTRGLQCEKSLWLKKHKSSVLTPPDTSRMAIFDTGNRVGELACQLFPGGKKIPFDPEDFQGMLSLTNQFLNDGETDIYEAAFDYDGILVMADILHKGVNGWEIYEVKSSTALKPVYIKDSAIQYFVLQNCGLEISKVSVINISNSYVRGKELEIKKLFNIHDITDPVKAYQSGIPDLLEHFEAVLSDKHNEPDIDIGPHCSDPYPCDAKNYCWGEKNITESSIFGIAKLGQAKKFEMYKNGIIALEDIKDFESFSKTQMIQIDSELSNKTIINAPEIKKFTGSLTYPLYHLDFETFQLAIPEYEGLKPFQQIPSQYSIHIQDGKGGLENKEFLAEAGSDPRRTLAENLVRDIPADVMVLAYNKSFEQGIIRSLAKLYPDLAAHLSAVEKNIRDLMTPFMHKHYYSPAMKGSYSIKAVMPALVPEMQDAYSQLDLIHSGGDAMNAYSTLHLIKDHAQTERIRTALLEYCRLDTLSMVKILDKLKDG